MCSMYVCMMHARVLELARSTSAFRIRPFCRSVRGVQRVRVAWGQGFQGYGLSILRIRYHIPRMLFCVCILSSCISDASNRGMSKQYPLTVFSKSPTRETERAVEPRCAPAAPAKLRFQPAPKWASPAARPLRPAVRTTKRPGRAKEIPYYIRKALIIQGNP